jgi:hypothetical protein
LIEAHGLRLELLTRTHVLLNRDLHGARFLNRVPGLLLAVDRVLLGLGVGDTPGSNRLLVARRHPARS